MNYSILSDKEILKYAEPTTELEKALFSMLDEGLDSVREAEEEADDARSSMAELENDLENAQSDVEAAKDAAKAVIELIGEQDLSNKDEVLKMLQSIGDL